MTPQVLSHMSQISLVFGSELGTYQQIVHLGESGEKN